MAHDDPGQRVTQDLSFDEDSQSWIGTMTEAGDVSFAVQTLDSAGNVGRYTNKGRYYMAAALANEVRVFLPMVVR